MGLLNDIKDKLFRRRLLEERNRRRAGSGAVPPINPANAQCILILFPADSSSDRKTVDRWAEQHRKKGGKVKMAGYFSQEVGETNFGFPAISPKSLNWYGIPKTEALKEINGFNCELLFRLGPAGHRELDYLATINAAKLKVGPFLADDYATTPYHLQYDADRAPTIKEQLAAIEQIFSFTNASNTP